MEEIESNKVTEENEDRRWCVYMHTNKENGKVYIGITSRTLDDRCRKNGSGYSKHQIAFKRAIQKYGWDNFEHIIIEEQLTEIEAKQLEVEMIASYKSNCNRYKNPTYGYNMTDGGDGCIGANLSEETRKKMSIAKKGKFDGKNNPMYGHIYSDDDIIYLRKAHQHEMKSIVQLDLNGNFIKQYESIRDANRQTNINRQCISFCLQGKYQTAGGFKWVYAEDYEKLL